MHLVYLDQNIWVVLLRGCQLGDSSAMKLKQRLIELRVAGLVAIPLSAPHYLETWHRRETTSRHALAGLMRDVTAYATLAPVHAVERAWVRSEIWRRCNRAAASPEDCVLGHGVNHAFGSPTGRFRVVSSIATDSQPEGPPAEVHPELLDVAKDGSEHWEWFNIAGPEELLMMDGIDVRPEHRRGTADANYEMALRERLQHDEYARRRLDDFIVTQEFIRILDYINYECEELGIDPHGLFLADNPMEACRSFVDAVPITNVLCRLRTHRHRDHGFPLEQHDRTDMCVLGLAIPHCAVVATERRWIHAARQAGLDRRYGTTLCGSLAELNRALDGLSPTAPL
ncbi:hypothetical protein [Mycobacteroides abscessus]|uniref:hypothetical protein n=1 Tax=Mycobacteroides abscessus TaxID=36809 RepID=UPI000D3EBC4E|nr:hypothetical protein [Mycobacteroides abscessus]PVA35867.1 hypothetical protein DDJ88_08220 [Mycobacteroides abscessus]PVA52363.1 hypothetical protein DDJ35_01720 [Mycobacteroides abscessus]RIQ86558.1 hypothetical protein D2E34_21695 [Mycobacteroides abscessus]RIQ96560.1 hypothetical protein D2E30_15120 [Mycobacteroides abscessus]RIS06344.1 hypothetical protein D2E45_02800 [Mycobacteroides abscessus]